MKHAFFGNVWRGIIVPVAKRGWRNNRVARHAEDDVRHRPLLEGLEDRNLLSVNLLTQFPGIGPVAAGQAPDTQMAAGPEFVVQVTNNQIAFFTRHGTLVQDQSLDGFFAPADYDGTSKAEPAVIYDDMAQRFVVAVADGYSLLFAVSNTSDPGDGFTEMHQLVFPQPVGPGSAIEPSLDGHVRIGWNADAYVFTLDFRFYSPICYVGEGPDGCPPYTPGNLIVTIDRTSVLDQDPGTLVDYESTFGIGEYRIVAAAAMHDSAPGDSLWLVVGRYDHPNEVALVQMTNLLSYTPIFSKPVSFPGFETAYPNEELAQLDWRKDHLVTALTVDFNGGYGVRWFEFDTSGGDLTLIQSGDVDAFLGASTLLPAMALGTNLDLGLTYWQMAPNGSVSMFVTGRKADDLEGTMQPPVLVQEGEPGYAGDLGHYSGLAVDPVTGISFWAVNAYSSVDYLSSWGTAIANLEITADRMGAEDDVPLEEIALENRAWAPAGADLAQPVDLASLPTAATGVSGQSEEALGMAGTPVLTPMRLAHRATLVLPSRLLDQLSQRSWLDDWFLLPIEEVL